MITRARQMLTNRTGADTAAALLTAIALFLPVGVIAGSAADTSASWFSQGTAAGFAVVAFALAALRLTKLRALLTDNMAVAAALIATLSGAMAINAILASGLTLGGEAPGLWVFVIGWAFMMWRVLDLMSALKSSNILLVLAVPALFGVWLLYTWEVLVVGFSVPQVLLPPPSQIGGVLATKTAVLWIDFQQTFLKAVLAGFAIGCGSGFLMALAIDRIPFLQRGLLPLGSAVSAIPIVGIAPIMVMWFGFDWQSKAAVIVVMTFFPMLVNTLAGLQASDNMQRDLMRSYGASYRQILFSLRLPMAMPFVFNALKINSTLALIGAIVAEFFGTPIMGMGFRISTEIARMNVDMVWATITVAALAGSMFYGGLAVLERAVTFWHPSYRK